ncbi:HNH endonuclease-like protein [Thermacetogenium phaeum DSM 12270]|uniref:HNH endonuclease-like protein n=1 Tax=Thermacetogenium phaeum (strain ATCC BAA-254 / DSM 26808 / PB) TaxID=1089553 RepID=K4LCL6_THEPS|nr:hypothetical protein [Thermacetogenium phaeum]AFV10676.1 HNH endonuclease-like protein [Thermacetogenium phaeum DSM 12270]
MDCVIVVMDEKREKYLNIALNKVQGDCDKRFIAGTGQVHI